MGKLTHIYLGMLLTATGLAQSVSSFDVKATTSVSPSKEADKATPESKLKASTTALNPAIASRLVASEDVESYLSSIGSTLAMHRRPNDVFGLSQDTSVKPVVAAADGTISRRPIITATPLSEIVQQLKITTIIMGQKSFLVGTRTFTQGGQLPLSHRGKIIHAEVTEVTSQQISFRNKATGETAIRKMDMMPVGMTSGSKTMTLPGLVTDPANAPIELEAEEPPP
jgi:hypothetical protein